MNDRPENMTHDIAGITAGAPAQSGLEDAAAETSTEVPPDLGEHAKPADETLRALIEAIIYVSPEPVTLEAILKVLPGEGRDRVRLTLDALIRDFDARQHGIQIRPIAGGYKFSSKPEHHEVLRRFVKSLKPPVRLSKPALETLAVIAYRQPVTVPEIDEIRGVDCGGVIHTLLEKKLVVTAGRKNVVGRPILYRTSRDFLVHFGLKDVSELPSLREFEELARQTLGSDVGLQGRDSVSPNSAVVQSSVPVEITDTPQAIARSQSSESPSDKTGENAEESPRPDSTTAES